MATKGRVSMYTPSQIYNSYQRSVFVLGIGIGGKKADYDESEMCLHCWCKSMNLECQCGCQNEAVN